MVGDHGQDRGQDRGQDDAQEVAQPAQGRVSAVAIAIALIALGIFVVSRGLGIAGEQSTYARVGPQVFPYIVGAGLIVIGGLLLREAVKGLWPVIWAETDMAPAPQRALADRRQLAKVGLVGLGLVLNVLLMQPLGFVVSSSLMFALTTRAFGTRRILFDLCVGALFSGAIFAVFTFGLGLSLPAGTIWGGR